MSARTKNGRTHAAAQAQAGVRRPELARAACVALALLTGPTVGDIGSCGQKVEELDAAKFFAEKRLTDCAACSRCGYDTERCLAACAKDAPEQSFPFACFPLVHDGEVCLDALRAATCREYAAYVDDLAPSVPTECNFCPANGPSAFDAAGDSAGERALCGVGAVGLGGAGSARACGAGGAAQ